MEKKNIRQLAAVMFTDIVGYTATMQEDEIKANKQREWHRAVLEKRAEEFGGGVVHFFGDGAVTIFSSAFNCVICSIKIQQDLKKLFLPLRIGLHMGDVVYNDSGVYGDAVNVASRLETLSIAGSVLISEKIRDEIKNNSKIKTVRLGLYHLKNVKEPVKIYAVSNQGIKVPSSRMIKNKTGKAAKKIMVLPFVNMNEELGFDYFSDGLTEEVIHGMTKLEGLEVTSRTSAFAYKGQNEDVRSIGKTHSVSHILEGSVRKNKDKIRVTVQLIETRGGFHLWSETYEQYLKDIFEAQDNICARIIEKVEKSICRGYKKRLPRVPKQLPYSFQFINKIATFLWLP